VRALVESIGDALGAALVVGVGAAWAFAAYLVGSLAIGTLSPMLKALLSHPWLSGGRRSGGTLLRLCQRTRIKIETTLALTGIDIGQFLDQQLGADVDERPSRNPKVAPQRLTNKTPGVLEAIDFAAARESLNLNRERRLARAVLGELEDVAVSRLLGKEPELYGEWDRDRAEVEFRLALVPALLFLSVAVATRGSWWWLAIPVSILASWGLLRDAARSESHAEDVVVVALANDRVQSPVIERLVTAAEEAAQYGTRETIDAAAVKASSALTDALVMLERAGVSEPAAAHQAQELLDKAASAFGEGKPLFDSAAVERFEMALQELRPVAQAWVDIIAGRGAPSFDMQARVQAAHANHAGFQQAVRQQLARLSAPTTDVGTA
jgi:hypothetical protein